MTKEQVKEKALKKIDDMKNSVDPNYLWGRITIRKGLVLEIEAQRVPEHSIDTDEEVYTLPIGTMFGVALCILKDEEPVEAVNGHTITDTKDISSDLDYLLGMFF